MSDVVQVDSPLDRSGNGPYRLLRGVADRLVRRFDAALSDPRAAQHARLSAILAGSRDTAFGREHGLAGVRTLSELRRATPIRGYEALRPWFDRVAAGEQGVLTEERVEMLLETSGTTGRPKHLPVTASWARSVADAQSLWMLGLLREHEAASRGRALTIVSPAEHARSPGGLPIGANTGRMVLAQPWWVRARYAVPYEVFGLEPAELRQYAVLLFALGAEVTSWTTANPSTILLYARRFAEWREPLSRDLAAGTLRHGPAAGLDRLRRLRLELHLRRRPPPTDWRLGRVWPLASVNCWKGGPAGYFVDRISEALGADVPVREVGITASEGFFAIPLQEDWPGGVLWTLGHVLEFVGADEEPRGAWELELGERYRLVITTEAGLFRYDLQDLVEVVGFCRQTPLVRFVGKAGRYLNTTGERVSEAQVSEAMRSAAEETGLRPIGFSVRVLWAEVPAYELLVELPGVTPAGAEVALAAAFERALRRLNVEFDGRRDSARLAGVRVSPLPARTYQRFRADRVAEGAPEGQVKDPLLLVDDREWGRLAAANRDGRPT